MSLSRVVIRSLASGARFALLAFGVLAAACGDKSPSAPSPAVQTESGTVQAIGFSQFDFNPVRSGSSTITLAWSNSSVDLDLFLTDSGCPSADRLVAGGCNILGRSDGSTGTSERIERSVSTADRLKVWILNFSNVSQPFTITFEIR
jgi:hypothetical protein